MNPTEKIRTKSRSEFDLGLAGFLVISVAFCLFHPLTFNDYGIYLAAGKRLLNNQNPYADPLFRSGYLAATLFYFYSLLIPAKVGILLIRTFSLFALFRLIRFSVKDISTKSQIFCFSLILWSTPVRALIADTQVTGILIALFLGANSFSFALRPSKIFFYGKNFMCSLLFLISVDIRPQLAIVVLIIWVAQNKKYFLGAYTLLSWIVLRISVGHLCHKNFNYIEIHQLLAINKWYLPNSDSTSFWRLAEYWGMSPSAAADIAIFLFGITFLFAFYNANLKSNLAFITASLTPLLLTYSHPYDFIFLVLPIVIRVSANVLNLKSISLAAALFIICLPKNGVSILENLAMDFMLLMACLMVPKGKTIRHQNTQLFPRLIFSAFLSTVFEFFMSDFNLSSNSRAAANLFTVALLLSINSLYSHLFQPVLGAIARHKNASFNPS
jgi:hypothetical protein